MLLVSYPGTRRSSPRCSLARAVRLQQRLVAWPHIQSGKLKVIAVTTAQRVQSLPDVPTVAESGLPGYESLLFYLLVGPANVPRAIVTRLNEAVKQIKQRPMVKQQLATLGAIPLELTPEELGAFLQRDLDKWTKVVRQSGARLD